MTGSSGSSSQSAKYFDLITSGFAKLKRVRYVPVPRGSAKLACDLKAFHGARGAASITPFDLMVVGHDAKACVDQNGDDANDVRKDVFVKFNVGDASIRPFPVDNGEGVVLKGRLLRCERVSQLELPSEYELVTRGLGYVNFVREIQDEDKTVLTCTLNALVGPEPTSPEEKVARVPFDVTITGEEADALIRQYAEAINDRQKVLVGFTLRGARIHSFPRGGEREGEIGYAIQSGLSKVSFVTLNGQRVYDAPRSADDGANLPAGSASEVPPVDPNAGDEPRAA